MTFTPFIIIANYSGKYQTNTLANVKKDKLSQYDSLNPLGVNTIYVKKYEI